MNKKGGDLRPFCVLIIILGIYSGFFLFTKNDFYLPVLAMSPEIKINEIAWMGTENSSNDEWIELFNSSNQDINLDGWLLSAEDGSPSIQLLGVVGAGQYFLLERTDDNSAPGKEADLIYTGSLGNSGEYLKLMNDKGEVVDFVDMSSEWLAGNNDTKQTMVRTEEDTWLSSLMPLGTPGETNDFFIEKETVATSTQIIKNSTSSLVKINKKQDSNLSSQNKKSKTIKPKPKKAHIIISEILPNALGSDKKKEFIELYNAGKDNIDLFEWQIRNNNKQIFRFRKPRIIKTNEFIVLYREKTKIAMNNNGDTISLYKNNRKTAIDKVKYKKAPENRSLNCLVNGKDLGQLVNVDCEWSEKITPGQKNEIKLPNRPPTPDFSVGDFLLARTPIIFDASDTVDPDEDELEYFWDFGDGFTSTLPMPDHTFARAGKYKVSLQVDDGEFKKEINHDINIMDWKIDKNKINKNQETKIDWDNLKIDEILPNPKGIDADEEYIEIINQGKSKINLAGWQVDDAEGGSRPYIFKDSVFLEGGAKFLLSREDSNLALNNNKDEVRLIAPDKSLVDLVSYQKAKEGEVYIRKQDKKWVWSGEKQKGQFVKNKITNSFPKKKAITKKIKIKISKNNQTKFNKLVFLEEVSKEKVGKKIKTRGKVVVLPGVLGSQYFYIASSSGLQIYNYKKNFPDLQLGDLLEVSGELTSFKGEARLKIHDKKDIKILEHRSVLLARQVNCNDLLNLPSGSLVQIKGEVTEKKGKKFFVDDGQGEVLVYIKDSTNVNLDNIHIGDYLLVNGILIITKTEQKILVRSQDDISQQDKMGGSRAGTVLGETITDNTWVLKKRKENTKSLFYVYSFLVTGLVIIGIFLYKQKK